MVKGLYPPVGDLKFYFLPKLTSSPHKGLYPPAGDLKLELTSSPHYYIPCRRLQIVLSQNCRDYIPLRRLKIVFSPKIDFFSSLGTISPVGDLKLYFLPELTSSPHFYIHCRRLQIVFSQN